MKLRCTRAAQLTSAPGPSWVVEHVGSTSVPGLAAKPVIDLALRRPDGWSADDVALALTDAGWTRPVAVGDHTATFLLLDGVRSAIGHVFTAQQWPQAHVRLFAQWLREHPADRDAYGELKRTLVAAGVWGSPYTTAKGAFVLDVVNRARRAGGLPPVSGPL